MTTAAVYVHHWLVAACAVDGCFPATCQGCGAEHAYTSNPRINTLATHGFGSVIRRAKRAQQEALNAAMSQTYDYTRRR